MTLTMYDVLKRALTLVQAGPVSPPLDNCVPYCPYCALSEAKTQLDREQGTGLSTLEVLTNWNTLTPPDLPLVEAVAAVRLLITDEQTISTQDSVIALFEKALNQHDTV